VDRDTGFPRRADEGATQLPLLDDPRERAFAELVRREMKTGARVPGDVHRLDRGDAVCGQ
jgi:hypothetical protein